jgi:GTP-binding protein EngB required for normal cell division
MPSERRNSPPSKIVFFGARGVGKTTFINAIANYPLTTAPLTRFTTVPATIGDATVDLIDSPGFGPFQLIQGTIRDRIAEWVSDNIVDRRCHSAFVYLYSFAQTYNYEHVLQNFKTIYDLAQENGIRTVVVISNKSNLADPEEIEFWWEKHREDAEAWGKGAAHFDFKGEGNIAKATLKRILEISAANVERQDPTERVSIARSLLSPGPSLRDRVLQDIERDSVSGNSTHEWRGSSRGNDSRGTSNFGSGRHSNANDLTTPNTNTSSASMGHLVGPAIEVAGAVASVLVDEYRASRAHERQRQSNWEQFWMTAGIFGLRSFTGL